jgi:hypothetical protein
VITTPNKAAAGDGHHEPVEVRSRPRVLVAAPEPRRSPDEDTWTQHSS